MRALPWYLWLIAIVVFLFISASVVAAFMGPEDPSHISAYLATLGGLMGAILTAGGLVIALAAILTLLTVQDKAAAVFREEYEKIRPQLEQLSDQRVEAHLLFRDALRVLEAAFITNQDPRFAIPQIGDWRIAESLARQALQLHPQLPNVHRAMGVRLAQKIQEMVKTGALARYRAIAEEGSYPKDMAAAAIEWLEEATAANQDAAGDVSMKLALMHGVRRDFQLMIQQIEQSVTSRPGLRRALQQPDALMLLSCAVDEELDQHDALTRLNRMLARPLEVTSSAFSQSVGSAPQGGIHWLAIARGEYWQTQARRPFSPLFLLVWVTDEDGKRLARAGCFPSDYRGEGRIEIPVDQQSYLSPEALHSELSSRFLLVCPGEPIGVPY